MKLWKVRVRRLFEAEKKKAKIIANSDVWIVVEAESADDAMKAAVAHADATATFGVKFLAFEPLEAASLALPFYLERG